MSKTERNQKMLFGKVLYVFQTRQKHISIFMLRIPDIPCKQGPWKCEPCGYDGYKTCTRKTIQYAKYVSVFDVFFGHSQFFIFFFCCLGRKAM